MHYISLDFFHRGDSVLPRWLCTFAQVTHLSSPTGQCLRTDVLDVPVELLTGLTHGLARTHSPFLEPKRTAAYSFLNLDSADLGGDLASWAFREAYTKYCCRRTIHTRGNLRWEPSLPSGQVHPAQTSLTQDHCTTFYQCYPNEPLRFQLEPCDSKPIPLHGIFVLVDVGPVGREVNASGGRTAEGFGIMIFRRALVFVREDVASRVESEEAGGMMGRLPKLLEELRVGVVRLGVSGSVAEVVEAFVIPNSDDEMPEDPEGVVIALPVSVLLGGAPKAPPKNGFRAFVDVVSGSSDPDGSCAAQSLPFRLYGRHEPRTPAFRTRRNTRSRVRRHQHLLSNARAVGQYRDHLWVHHMHTGLAESESRSEKRWRVCSRQGGCADTEYGTWSIPRRSVALS
jgi:hypothetical protein